MKQVSRRSPKKRSEIPYKGQNTPKQLRRRICDEAARIMIEDGINDFQHAKRKAGLHLNIRENSLLPSNREIESSVQERLRIYAIERLESNLHRHREIALDIMAFLSPFQPRIVGGILENYVTPSSPVNLHLFAQTPEEVSMFLVGNQIAFKFVDKRFRFHRDKTKYFPALQFSYKDVPIESAIFPSKGIRQAPLSPVHGSPMKRVSAEQLRKQFNID